MRPGRTLGSELGTPVVVEPAEALLQRRILSNDALERRQRVHAVGADVKDARDAGLHSRRHDVARAVDGGPLEVTPAAPVGDPGGGVVEDVDAVQRRGECLRVFDVAGGQLDAQLLEKARFAGRSDEGADVVATSDEPLGDMAA